MAINKTLNSFGETSGSETPASKSSGALGKILVSLLVLLVIAVLVVGALWGAKNLLAGDSIASVSSKDWQAIFLTNGQVYFGKVKKAGMKSVVLADIYYLQVVTKPLQSTATGATTAEQTQQELTLIKLGNEIHGPTDAMIINRDQILLTEKLKSDSRVVEAIASYVNEQATAEKK